jgi:hypothetical protein
VVTVLSGGSNGLLAALVIAPGGFQAACLTFAGPVFIRFLGSILKHLILPVSACPDSIRQI